MYSKCIKTHAECPSDADSNSCGKIILTTYHTEKCVYSNSESICKKEKKKCGDYNQIIGGVYINGDECKNLQADGGESRCDFDYANTECRVHYKECTDSRINDQLTCNQNIPSDKETKCQWNSSEKKCETVERKCRDYFYGIDESTCLNLKPEETDKKCLYSDGVCKEEFVSCDKYSQTTCENQTPLSVNGGIYSYNYEKICYWKDDCQQRNRKCEEYYGLDYQICSRLEVTDTNKVCAPNPSYYNSNTSPSNIPRCREVYNSCESYNNNQRSKTRNHCEDISLSDPNKKCLYIREIDKCIESNIYETCEEYKESDKYTCESIIPKTSHAKCVLDKDFKCKERAFHCFEAFSEEDCHFYAKANSDDKRCIYSGNECREVYKSCEEFIEKDKTACEALVLYNGKKCVYESDKCVSKDKICTEANNEDECKLMALTGIGVADPERKVCDFLNYNTVGPSSCQENYKFCSDYRGIEDRKCELIKPYDETGTYIDITSECEINDSGLCQRISKDCSAGNRNPIQCAELSLKIRDNHEKFCAYIGDSCIEYYKNCGDIILESGTPDSTCTNYLPKNYLTSRCEVETDDNGKRKCVEKKTCDAFKEEYYGDLCSNFNQNCTYSFSSSSSYSSCNLETSKVCDSMVFYTQRNDNETVCNSLETDSPNQICTYKKGTSRCELKFKELPSYQTEETHKQEDSGESSALIKNTINLTLILLSLLL